MAGMVTVGAVNQSAQAASKVEVNKQADGSYRLMRNGEPYEVKGAGYGNGDSAAKSRG